MLEIKNCTKRFGALRAVDSLSLCIDKGEIVGLIGPNGAGKTTLVNVISGVYPPNEGTIMFEGIDITKFPAFRRWNLGITRTFQTVNLYSSLTVKDNIYLGLIGKKKEFETIPAHIHDFAKYTGLFEKFDVKASYLTLYERKVTELLRCLAIRPKLIMVDEPVAGLTESEQKAIFYLLKKINEEGVTIICIEHLMKFVMKLCKRIVVMDKGKIIADGDPVSVCSNKKVIEVYLGEEYT